MQSTPPQPEVIPWTDIAGVWISGAGALASTVIAIVAVVFAVRAAGAEGLRAAEAEESQRRERRAAFATDLLVWLEQSTAITVLGSELAIYNREWVGRGEALSARARTLDSPGATDLLVSARAARNAIETLPFDRRIDVVLPVTGMLKLWVEAWVSTPERSGNGPEVIEAWVDAWAKESAEVEAEGEAEAEADPPRGDEERTDGGSVA
jgi:hypothetical protein